MSDAGARARSRARIIRVCESTGDARTLRLSVVEELRRVVDFDAYAWLLTDPETCVGSAPLADVPWLAELPLQIRLKYLSGVNRWTGLGKASVALLSEVTGGDLTQSLVWQGLLVRYGISDAASMVFRDRFGCWGFLELWRSGARETFDRVESDFLTSVGEPLTLALRRCQANLFAPLAPTAPTTAGPVVLLLSPELQVRAQTEQTMEVLHVLVPPAPDQPPIPASAYNVAAQLLAVEAGVDNNRPSARVYLKDGLWLTVRAARIGGPDPSAEQDIAVTIEQTSPGDRMDMFARAFGLSPRESELLLLLTAGHDTREIARRLVLSGHTVQDHLKSIFAKTGVRNRRSLLSRALG